MKGETCSQIAHLVAVRSDILSLHSAIFFHHLNLDARFHSMEWTDGKPCNSQQGDYFAEAFSRYQFQDPGSSFLSRKSERDSISRYANFYETEEALSMKISPFCN